MVGKSSLALALAALLLGCGVHGFVVGGPAPSSSSSSSPRPSRAAAVRMQASKGAPGSRSAVGSARRDVVLVNGRGALAIASAVLLGSSVSQPAFAAAASTKAYYDQVRRAAVDVLVLGCLVTYSRGRSRARGRRWFNPGRVDRFRFWGTPLSID